MLISVVSPGSTKAGKSTLISRLAHPAGEATTLETAPESVPLDLGLGYTVLDIGDGEGQYRLLIALRLWTDNLSA